MNNPISQGIIVCQICNKDDRIALECVNKFDKVKQLVENYTRSRGYYVGNKMEWIPLPNEQKFQSLVATNMRFYKHGPIFYDNSSVTTHILNDPSKITIISSFEWNESLYVGNNESLVITHIGWKKTRKFKIEIFFYFSWY